MFNNSFALGSLDPSGAAATWRARLSGNTKNLFTSASSAAEYRFQGNQPKIQNSYNYKQRVSAGIRGVAFDQQNDDNYWRSKQIQPTINRPLGSGIRQAALINEGIYNINPIAGTNAFGGGVVSRASGLNPTNYSLATSDDIEDRLRAHAVPANDPMSAEFAKSLPAGQKLDPGNVEGDAMVNTFASDNSIARNAKTQAWDSKLFPAEALDEDINYDGAQPFGTPGNTSLEYVRKASIRQINEQVSNKTTNDILTNYRNAFKRNLQFRAQRLGGPEMINQNVNPVARVPSAGGGSSTSGGDSNSKRGDGRGNTDFYNQREADILGSEQISAFAVANSIAPATATKHVSVPKGKGNKRQKATTNTDILTNNEDPSYNSNTTRLKDENNSDTQGFFSMASNMVSGIAQSVTTGIFSAISSYAETKSKSPLSKPAVRLSEDAYKQQFDNTFDQSYEETPTKYGQATRPYDFGDDSPSPSGGGGIVTARERSNFNGLSPSMQKLIGDYVNSDEPVDNACGNMCMNILETASSVQEAKEQLYMAAIMYEEQRENLVPDSAKQVTSSFLQMENIATNFTQLFDSNASNVPLGASSKMAVDSVDVLNQVSDATSSFAQKTGGGQYFYTNPTPPRRSRYFTEDQMARIQAQKGEKTPPKRVKEKLDEEPSAPQLGRIGITHGLPMNSHGEEGKLIVSTDQSLDSLRARLFDSYPPLAAVVTKSPKKQSFVTPAPLTKPGVLKPVDSIIQQYGGGSVSSQSGVKFDLKNIADSIYVKTDQKPDLVLTSGNVSNDYASRADLRNTNNNSVGSVGNATTDNLNSYKTSVSKKVGGSALRISALNSAPESNVVFTENVNVRAVNESIRGTMRRSELNNSAGNQQSLESASARNLFESNNTIARPAARYASDTNPDHQSTSNVSTRNSIGLNVQSQKSAENQAKQKLGRNFGTLSTILEEELNESIGNSAVRAIKQSINRLPSASAMAIEANDKSMVDLTAKLVNDFTSLATDLSQDMELSTMDEGYDVQRLSETRMNRIMSTILPLTKAIAQSPNPAENFGKVADIFNEVERRHNLGDARLHLELDKTVPYRLTSVVSGGSRRAVSTPNYKLIQVGAVTNSVVKGIESSLKRKTMTYDKQELGNYMAGEALDVTRRIV
jgi:hypothetical protein